MPVLQLHAEDDRSFVTLLISKFEAQASFIIYGHSSDDDDGQGHSVGLGHEPAQGSC